MRLSSNLQNVTRAGMDYRVKPGNDEEGCGNDEEKYGNDEEECGNDEGGGIRG